MKIMKEVYNNMIIGAINGFDRIRFRGTLRWLASERGINTFASSNNILLKDFMNFAKHITKNIREEFDNISAQRGIETIYLRSSKGSKEELARSIAKEKNIISGPICNFSVLETCYAPRIRGNKAEKTLELKIMPTKCIHLYHYFDHPTYGFGHVRLQTWAPYNIFICLNGRHWLERDLQKNDIGYLKNKNCFPWLENVNKAQELLDKQQETNWSEMLNGLVEDMLSGFGKLLPVNPEYYWSADDTEWASDIMFSSKEALDSIYNDMIYFGLKSSDSPAVMRYLGKQTLQGRAPKEVMSNVKTRYEGVRIKHYKNSNSVKMYNKSDNILRIETTITNTRDFKVFRHPDDDKNRPASWQKMRKGVSDLHRRSEVSQACNDRYADAIAANKIGEKFMQIIEPVSNKIKKAGKLYRGFNPWRNDDFIVLSFLALGQNVLNGFRNKELRDYLYPEAKRLPTIEQRKYSSRTTRRIKLLRVHGLIKKMPKENRYILTSKGQKLASSLRIVSTVDLERLTKEAA